jgi:hypothetical protein
MQTHDEFLGPDNLFPCIPRSDYEAIKHDVAVGCVTSGLYKYDCSR